MRARSYTSCGNTLTLASAHLAGAQRSSERAVLDLLSLCMTIMYRPLCHYSRLPDVFSPTAPRCAYGALSAPLPV